MNPQVTSEHVQPNNPIGNHPLPSIPSEDLQRAGMLYGQVKELRLRLTNVHEDVLER